MSLALEENKLQQTSNLKEKEDNSDNTAKSIKTRRLSSGYNFPLFGYGTSWRYGINAYWGAYQNKILENKITYTQNAEQKKLEECIVTAIKHGYRCIDTAQGYSTEQIIGNVLKNKKYNISRNDIFITTKLGSKERTIKQCYHSIENSLKLLNTNYIDLYLIHSPHTKDNGMDVINIYKYLLTNYKSKGIIRSIGVSNFNINHIKCIKKYNLELPSVNQISFSCFMNPKKLIHFCNKNDIIVQGYSPLCKASNIVKTNKILLNIAKKYNKKWSDICLKYCFQKNIAIICQSKHNQRIQQNICSYFDKTFIISENDMIELDKLNDIQLRLSWGSQNPLDIQWGIFDEL